MHRSGTSLLASLFQRSGVDMGDRLVPATQANPHGHFEHEPFVHLHERLLHANRLTMYAHSARDDAAVARGLDWPTDLQRTARDLVHDRVQRVAGSCWGWKDPRTTLVLDAWRSFLHQADLRPAFVLVWRPAAEVLDSLRRRNDPDLRRRFPGEVTLRKAGLPTFHARRAAAMWALHNRAVIRFLENPTHEPRDAVLVRARDVAERWTSLARSVTRSLRVPLETADTDRAVDRSLMRETPPERYRRALRAVAADDIERRLQGLSLHPD